jgi:hypothetical protein
MKASRYRDFGNTLCQMFVGWRMVANDYQTLSALGTGRLEVDVLAGHATWQEGPIRLYIAGELQAWLRQRLQQEEMPVTEIEMATLSVEIESGRMGPRRSWLRARCQSRIVAAGREFRGALDETINVDGNLVT